MTFNLAIFLIYLQDFLYYKIFKFVLLNKYIVFLDFIFMQNNYEFRIQIFLINEVKINFKYQPNIFIIQFFKNFLKFLYCQTQNPLFSFIKFQFINFIHYFFIIILKFIKLIHFEFASKITLIQVFFYFIAKY